MQIVLYQVALFKEEAMDYKTCASQEEALQALNTPENPPCRLALYPNGDDAAIALSHDRSVATKIPACCTGARFTGETIPSDVGPVSIVPIARSIEEAQEKMTKMK